MKYIVCFINRFKRRSRREVEEIMTNKIIGYLKKSEILGRKKVLESIKINLSILVPILMKIYGRIIN